MEEQAEHLVGGPVQLPVPKPNRGWFRAGDPRVNREGRPRGSKAPVPEGAPALDRADRTDRLMILAVPERQLAQRLRRPKGVWFTNLPEDYEIVGARFDAATQRVRFVIWSQTFPRTVRGAPIPEFAASKW